MSPKRSIFFYNESRGDGEYRHLPVRFLIFIIAIMAAISIAGFVVFGDNPNQIANDTIRFNDTQEENARLEEIIFNLQEQNLSVKTVLENLSGTEMSMIELIPSDSSGESANNITEDVIDEFSLALLQSYTDTISAFLSTVSQSTEQNKIWQNIPVAFPLADTSADITCHFGEMLDNFTGISKINEGVEYAVVAGSEVLATADGVIEKVERDNFWGRRVVIRHSNDVKTVYAHLGSTSVTQGRSIDKGDVLGEVGTTKWSVGPKLHYEIHKSGEPIDPELLIVSNELL